MKMLFEADEERCRMEIYNEYLNKIPKLLQQIEAVEKMYRKALMEDEMLQKKDHTVKSVQLYQQRLDRIKQQCQARAADLQEECHLIMQLKYRLEEESPALRSLQ